jgi:hypothetical protein
LSGLELSLHLICVIDRLLTTVVFGLNLRTLFEKLGHFTNVTIIFCLAKRCSFQKRVSKFTPKKSVGVVGVNRE